MPVDPSITRLIVAEELQQASAMARLNSWAIKVREDGLAFWARMVSRVDEEEYLLEVVCDDYKELPPLFEFLTAAGERRVPAAWPTNNDSFFHGDLLICYPFNRRAYKNYQGPHNDWALANWQGLRPGVNRLGDMLSFIQQRLNSKHYAGRRKP